MEHWMERHQVLAFFAQLAIYALCWVAVFAAFALLAALMALLGSVL